MRCAGAASAATLTSPSSTPTMQQSPRVVTSMHVIPLRRMGKPLLTCGAAPMFHTGTAPLAAQALTVPCTENSSTPVSPRPR